ncbi:hypothetical protein KCU78_g10138, partial [Aureobasidium melanogenum]
MSHSAFLGQPPATQDDFYIIKGMYRAAYASNKDPSKGYLFVPRKPADYEYNDKQASIIVGMAMAIVVMLSGMMSELAQKSISRDITYGYKSLLAWTVVDLTLAVVVASLPVISALIPKAWGDTTHSSRVRRTTLRQPTSKGTQGQYVVERARRNTVDSEEDGILREDRIELSFARNSKQIQTTEASQTSLYEDSYTKHAI